MIVSDKFRNLLAVVFLFVGNATRNSVKIINYILSRKIDWGEFFKHSRILVFSVVGPVFTIGVALGVVLGIQLGPEFISRGLGNQMGILSAITMSRELIPVVASMMIATQYGTGLAAELANMKITEQIDALKVLKVDPLNYLVVPRFLAAVIFVPVVNFLATIIAVLSTFLAIWLTNDLQLQGFLGTIWDSFELRDMMLCIYKSSIFGAVIVFTAITLGLEAHGGARGVGKATTMTVILSFIFIIVLDYIISSIYL